MKRILITGGNGFLGSNLVQYFVEQGYEVLAVSRDSNNLTSVLDKIHFIKNNTENYDALKDEVQKFCPEYVIHSAWDGGNNYSDIHGLNQFYKNIPLSLSLLEIINSLEKKPTFIGIGSFAEYGEISSQASETDIETPINFYGLSKLTIKKLTELYCSINNIHWVWVRPCYIYGPRDVSTRLIPKIITGLLSNQPINLDSCNVTIDYLHINDFSRAVDTIIRNNLSGVYNICSGIEYNLKDIVNFLYNALVNNSLPTFGVSEERTSVSRYICGTSNKLKSISNWNNTISIHDGLLDTITYYKDNA